MKRQYLSVDNTINIRNFYQPENKSLILERLQITAQLANLDKIISVNDEIEILNINSCSIGDQGAKLFSKFISMHPSLKEINLSYNRLSDTGLVEIAKALTGSNINTIIFDGNKFGNFGLAALTLAFKANQTIQNISFVNCDITENIAESLAKFIKSHPTLQKINLANNKIKDGGLKAIASSLTTSNIQNIIIDANKIGAQGAKSLASVLKADTGIKRISMAENKIGDIGIQFLTHALKSNTILTSINLEKNQIGQNGAEAIGNLLMYNTSLKEINLGKNIINQKGLEAISQALKSNSSLEIINVRKNKEITNFNSFFNAMKVNNTIKSINLSGNPLNNNMVIKISEIITKNTKLETLACESCEINNEGGKEIAHALKSNSNLTSLDLSDNKIEASGIKLFAGCSNLKLEPDLTGNNDGIQGVQALRLRDEHILGKKVRRI